MSTLSQDKNFLTAGIQELEKYLLSDELFWPLTGTGVNLPRLTIGGLLLARARLTARMAPQAIELHMEAIQSKWRSAWERKAAREIHARFNLWRSYLEDYRQSPASHANDYPHQVQWRVMLQMLSGEVMSSLPEVEALTGLDQILKANWIPGDFVWDPDLVPSFPESIYWFLYGKLKTI